MILEQLRRDGSATVHALARSIHASLSTIRRDLELLTEQGYLERTRGGALLMPQFQATFEREPHLNAHFQRRQKIAIGRVAALRLKHRESVILDSSSTVMEAVRVAVGRDIAITAVTNGLDIAQLCASSPGWRVIMPGGTIRPGTRLTVGDPGETFLRSVHADVCLIGAYSVSGALLTDASLEVATVKRMMIGAARRKILLVDSSKFQPPAFCTFAQLSDIDEVITDSEIRKEHLDALRANGVEVTVVPMDDVAEVPAPDA